MGLTVTVLIDAREQYPLLFPSSLTYYPFRDAREGHLVNVISKTRTINTGDYLLEGSSACIVERKKDLSELFNNLMTKDYKRCTDALDRLSKFCAHSYLLLEDTVTGMFTAAFRVGCPEVVLDSFLREVTSRGIRLLWVGRCDTSKARTRVGELVLRIMLAHEDFGKKL